MGQADRAPTTRRTAMAAGFTLSVAAGAATVLGIHSARAEAHPDAALLALEPPILGMVAVIEGMLGDVYRLEAAAHEAAGPRPASTHFDGSEWAAYRARIQAASAANGFDAALSTHTTADRELVRTVAVLETIPARTLDGLRFKARMVEHGDGNLPESIVDDLLAIDAAMRA